MGRCLRFDPVVIHSYSARLYRRRRLRVLAKALHGLNIMVFRTRLPPEVQVGPGLSLGHHGFGVVIHPNTSIGRGVTIMHRVTLGANLPLVDPRRMVVEDGVTVGVGALILGPVRIGCGASIGAGCVITKDVPPGATMVGNPAHEQNNGVSGRLG